MFSLSARFCLAASLSFACIAQANGQDAAPAPQQPMAEAQPTTPYTLKVNTQIVVLDVVVTDKQGNIVQGLNRDDFQVTEDDDPQRIKAFERPQTHVLPSNQKVDSTADLDKTAPETPVSIIVLDEMNTRFEDEAFARYSLKKYLNTQGDQLSQPTMLVAVDMQNFNVLRDYTTSKKEILDALEHHLARYPWHLANGGASWGGEIFNKSFNALIEVAQATSGHVGHKNMIWIGRGFPNINMGLLQQDQQDALTEAIQTCTNMLRDARITLYTVDPAGVRSAPVSQDDSGFNNEDPFGGDVNFTTMAEATGGHAYYGRNDVDNLIQKSVTNGINFYTLTYTPNKQSEDPKAFRKIHVTLKDPNLKAIAREGYYPDAPAAPAILEGKPSSRLVFDLTMAGSSTMVYDSVPLTILRDAPNSSAFTIHVDEKGLDWKNNGTEPRTADLAVMVAVFDRKGKLLERNSQIVTATAPPLSDNEVSKPRALDIHTQLKVAPPAARIRVVVRSSATGKIGAENFLLVDKNMIVTPTSVFPKTDRDAMSQRHR